MSKFLKYILVVATILFVLVLIPLFIPLGKYKDLIKTKVHEAVNRELTIDGDISLSLLPRPKVKIENVKLSSLPNATFPNLLELKSAEAAIAISPLLRGKIVISYVKLSNPKVILEKLKDGKGTWEFENKTTENASTQPQTNDKLVKAEELPFRINRIIIDKGELIYIEKNDRKNIQDLDLNVKFENIKGPVDFDLTFKILNQDISLNGKIKEIGDIIPLVVELKAQGTKVKLAGDISLDDLSFKGDINSEGNLKNLKSISSDSLPEGLKEDYKFSAKINASKKNFEGSDISFRMGALAANGQANYVFDDADGALNLVFEPGKIVLNCTPASSVKDGYVTNKIQLQANSIKPFLEALKIDLKEFPQFLAQAFSIDADLKYKDQELLIQNLAFNLGKANLQGIMGVKNWTHALGLFYDLKTKNGDALLSLIGGTSPVSLDDLQVKGESTKNDKNIKTNTTISVAQTEINIKGIIDTDKEIKPDLIINVKGNNLSQTITRLTKKSSIKKLGGFNINTKANGNLSKELKITLDKSSVMLANETVNLNGTGELKLDSKKPKVSLNFLASGINLNMLTDNASVSSSAASHSSMTSAHTSHWSKEKIDLSFLNSFDGDLNLTIQKIISGGLIFDNFKTRLTINDGVLNITSLTGSLYGGKIEGNARVAAKKDGSVDASLKAILIGAQLRNIVPTQGKIKMTQGTIDFNADIKTKGVSAYSYVDNLEGAVTLNGRDGRLSGLDLQKIVRTLNDAKNLQNILKAIDNSFLQGETAFKSIESRIVIDKGIAKLVSSKVIASGGEANATGNINLPKYLLDVEAEIKVDIKNMPPFKAHLYGRLDNPQYKLDLRALQQYLVNNVLTNVIDTIKSGKTKPEDILKGILGGGKNKQSQEEEQQEPNSDNHNNDTPSPKNEVNDLINKGFKSLFK